MPGKDGFEAVAALVRDRSGLVLGPDKRYLAETRLAGLLRREGLADLAALAGRLHRPGGAGLAAEVVEAMTTNESMFFRDGRPFEHVRRHVLPSLHRARPRGQALRIWYAAASSGQEAYSLAMLAAGCRALLGDRPVRILGTDIAREQLARAREGFYTRFEVRRGLPAPLLAEHFREEEAGWRIDAGLKAGVEFREWNLLADPVPLGRFDVIFCRNVLLYFDPPTKTRVLEAIARLLPPDGYLYLGAAETALGLTGSLRPVPGEHGVYSPTPDAAGPEPYVDGPLPARRRAVLRSDRL